MNAAFIREVGTCRWIFRTSIRQFYKRIARRDHVMRLPSGEFITLPIANHFASEVFVTGADVDWGSERLFYALLARKGAFLDIGAHIGYYSLYMLPRTQLTFCFEPDPRVRGFLEKNVAAKRNAQIMCCAVSEKPGTARFTLERDAAISHLSVGNEEGENIIDVEVVTIDSFVRERELKVEAIKIDVEGFDTAVISGALNVLKEQQPLVLTEAKADGVLFKILRGVAYRIFAYIRDPQTREKRFMELTSAEEAASAGHTKMLFLVPERLVEEIRRKGGLAKALD